MLIGVACCQSWAGFVTIGVYLFQNEQVGLILDSDDDDCMEMSSPATSSSPLSVNGGLFPSS